MSYRKLTVDDASKIVHAYLCTLNKPTSIRLPSGIESGCAAVKVGVDAVQKYLKDHEVMDYEVEGRYPPTWVNIVW